MTKSNSRQTPEGVTFDDFSISRVTPGERRSIWSISLVRLGYVVSATNLLFGFVLSQYVSFWTAVAVAATYSAFISVVTILMGIIGAREGTSFPLSSRLTFGRDGSRLPSLVIAVSSTAFYGYLLAAVIDVLPWQDVFAHVVECLLLGLLFFIISARGFFRGLRRAAYLAVPLMFTLAIVGAILAIQNAGGLSQIMSAEPQKAGDKGFWVLVGLGFAKWIHGAMVAPDITRFGKTTYAPAIVSGLVEFFAGNFVFNSLGILIGLGVGSGDLGRTFAIIGLTWLASVAVLVQALVEVSYNLYSVSLALSNVLGMRRFVTNSIVGIIGIIIAFVGLQQGVIESFVSFVEYVGYALPAIAGIMIADYFIVHRMRYPQDMAASSFPRYNWIALLSYILAVSGGVALGAIIRNGVWHSLPLIGFVLYLLLMSTVTLALRGLGKRRIVSSLHRSGKEMHRSRMARQTDRS